MDSQGKFWKDAARKIEYLFNNPIRLKNEDLLVKDLEDTEVITEAVKESPKFKAKFSAFNSHYTNYKPLVMTILKNSQRFAVSRPSNERTPSPFVYRKKAIYPGDTTFNDSTSNLEIYGQRAGFAHLPKIFNSAKAKSIILKVREKYDSLYRLLRDEDNLIRPRSIMKYLLRVSTIKKSSPRLNQSAFRSESKMKRRPKQIYPENDYMNHIQEHAKQIFVRVIKDVFDPINEGVVSEEAFFGTVGIFEYSCSGFDGNTSKLDVTNQKHLRYLSNQIIQLKGLYFKYKESSLLTKPAMLKLFKSVDGLEQLALDIFDTIKVKTSANFGQFLSIVPLLLENYSNIMQNLD